MQEVINNIVGRDYEDTHREESPLRKADDAVMLDNTYLTQEEQVAFVMNEVSRLRDSIRSA
jgi:CMP/dCMP kinase